MTKDARKLAGEIRLNAPRLDLHGRDPHGIENQVDQFLYENYNKKELSVEIIYGVGKGVLSEITRKYLSTHPLVENVIDKGGYCIVILSE